MKITGIVCVIAGALTAVTLAMAQDAHADTQGYLDFLDSHGIHAKSDDSLTVGRKVCADTRAMGTEGLDLNGVRALNAGFSEEESAVILYASISELCPELMNVAEEWMNS